MKAMKHAALLSYIHHLQKRNNYRLKSEISIMLHGQLGSTHYTAGTFQKHLCNLIATMKSMDDFCYAKEAIMCRHILLSAKMNGTQRRTVEECIICTAVCQKALLGLKQCQTAKN